MNQAQAPPPEVVYQEELNLLGELDAGIRPAGWRLSPASVVTFLLGSGGPLKGSRAVTITPKFVGERALVERCVVTLAGQRGLLLVGEPGTAKSMLSELLAAAISGSSQLTVQGTAGTHEEHLRYGWNYSLLLARGPHPEALVPSPLLTAMRTGGLARVEELTRCLPEVQDALVSLLSDRRISVPELGQYEYARAGFNLIATANLRDKGVSEMSSALKRRFNFEVVPPIADRAAEVALIQRQARAQQPDFRLDDSILDALVTAFRDLRSGLTGEGWSVEKPSTVMSTAEAVAVAGSLALQASYFESQRDPLGLLPGYLLGTVSKDDPKDRARLLAYWDGPVRRRAEQGARLWKRLLELRSVLEE
ncbi:MAG: AAA family ATPase [Vulcanimicrobiota bacterium]